jgi:hypothetical protein
MTESGGSQGGRYVSRRAFLGGAAAGGSGLLAAGLFAAPAHAASGQVPPNSVNYQPRPNGKARCGTCAFFQSPSSCKFVQGAISPTGWCMLYRAKG